MLGNYTWGRSIDYASFSSVSGNNAGPDPFNIRNRKREAGTLQQHAGCAHICEWAHAG